MKSFIFVEGCDVFEIDIKNFTNNHHKLFQEIANRLKNLTESVAVLDCSPAHLNGPVFTTFKPSDQIPSGWDAGLFAYKTTEEEWPRIMIRDRLRMPCPYCGYQFCSGLHPALNMLLIWGDADQWMQVAGNIFLSHPVKGRLTNGRKNLFLPYKSVYLLNTEKQEIVEYGEIYYPPWQGGQVVKRTWRDKHLHQALIRTHSLVKPFLKSPQSLANISLWKIVDTAAANTRIDQQLCDKLKVEHHFKAPQLDFLVEKHELMHKIKQLLFVNNIAE